MACFCSWPGKSRKNVASNLSARLNSGGSLATSLAVQTTNTSESWSLSQLRNVPNIRDDTPLSVWPELPTPANAFSTSSIMATHGAIASMICKACRVRSSVWPTSDPISVPTSRISTGRPVSLPRHLQNCDLPQPGGDNSSTPRGRFSGLLRLGCSRTRLVNAFSDANPPRLLKSSLPRYRWIRPLFFSVWHFRSQTASGRIRP